MFSSIQNAEFIFFIMSSWGSWAFFGILRSKSKMENDNYFDKKNT